MAALTTVIFDVDGVLLNTAELHAKAWSMAAERILGIDATLSVNEIRGVSPRGVIDLLSRSNQLSSADAATMIQEKSSIYINLAAEFASDLPMEGVFQTLAHLVTSGWSLAAASSSRHAGTLLSKVGLSPYFAIVSDGSFRGPLKPNPTQFLDIARRLRVHPASCAVVEDSTVGLEAARACAMYSVGVGSHLPPGSADLHIEALIHLTKSLKDLCSSK